MKRDFYKILGVSRKAKSREIQRAYQKLGRRLHPDVNPGDRKSAARYREVQEAYRVLSDRKSRALYDRQGEEGLAPREGDRAAEGGSTFPESKGWESIVREIFHDDAEVEGEGASSRGDDVHQVLEVSFLESLKGAKRTVVYQREVVCRSCEGRRFAAGAPVEECLDCGGSGLVVVQKGPYTVKKLCRRCSGTGEVSARPCRGCAGKGVSLRTERRVIRVPAGCDSGHRVAVSEAGQPGRRGGAFGDLVVTVRVQPNPALIRRGYNLYCAVPITVSEAALGATILVPTVEGKIPMEVSPGTQSGEELRLRGMGVPLPGGEGRGDLYVKVRVVVPRASSPRIRALFKELAELSGEDPREGT